MDENRVVVAELMRPRGNRGELVARSQSDVPGRLQTLKRVNVRLADGTDTEVTVQSAWEFKGDWVLKFDGVDSISDAERFKGADVWVSRADRAPLPEGEFFQSDLIGCSVLDAASGDSIGTVTGWQQYGGPALMEVDAKGREVLVPFVPSICVNVDVAGQVIRVDLPEGLLDL